MSDYTKLKAKAKQLADQAHHWTYGDGGDAVIGHALAAEAQVYATLALAEATQNPRAQVVRIDAP